MLNANLLSILKNIGGAIAPPAPPVPPPLVSKRRSARSLDTSKWKFTQSDIEILTTFFTVKLREKWQIPQICPTVW